MPSHGDKKSRLKGTAIAALMTNPSVDAAARVVGISPTTLHRWLRDPDFRAELDEAQAVAIGQAARTLAGLAPGAMDAIRNSLGRDQPAALRLSGARLALDKLETLTAFDMLERRLRALEERYET